MFDSQDIQAKVFDDVKMLKRKIQIYFRLMVHTCEGMIVLIHFAQLIFFV